LRHTCFVEAYPTHTFTPLPSGLFLSCFFDRFRLTILRILFLSPSGQTGGAEWSLLDIITSLRASKPDWDFSLLAAEHGPLTDLAQKAEIPTNVIPFPAALGRLGDSATGGPAGNGIGRICLSKNIALAIPGVYSYVSKLRDALRATTPHIVQTN